MLRVVRKLSFDGLVAVSVALLAATLARYPRSPMNRSRKAARRLFSSASTAR
jgi:hypothetical protein